MYTDLGKFKRKLKKLIILSETELSFSDERIQKEYESLQRFELFCIKNNIKYVRNTTNSEPFDGTINNYKFQAKFVLLNHGKSLTYQISSQKKSGTINGKRIRRPYDVGDFNYYIVEVGGIIGEESKYENNFCIIPKSILIEQKILKSDTCKGKYSFGVCSYDYVKPHWSKKYWNNIPKELQ